MTKPRTQTLGTGLAMLDFRAWLSPDPLTIPKRAAISCKTIVASTENATAHNNKNPNSLPALLAIITVPGPMNAAVTKMAGPNEIDFLLGTAHSNWGFGQTGIPIVTVINALIKLAMQTIQTCIILRVST